MTVELNVERVGVELTYDQSLVQGDEIDVRAETDDDVSTRDGLKNDGRFTWTVPRGYKGSARFTVTGSDGGEDTGEIDFGPLPDGSGEV